jgi:small-conductance mechanosensitive channel
VSKNAKPDEGAEKTKSRPLTIAWIGAVLTTLLIVATLEISHRKISAFISSQERYVVGIESAILGIFVVEMVVGLLTMRMHAPHIVERGTRIRLVVRIVGYSIAFLSVVSILSANATLGISVGAIAGVVMAFAAQNIVGSMLAAVLILTTRMVRVGEEITVNQITGVVSNITLTHTVISVENEVVFVPNSTLMSSAVRRKKRVTSKHSNVEEW